MSDDLNYLAAVGLMVTSGKGSTSYIQRTLGLGYNAACRLVERMEDEGILAKPNHFGKREVLLTAARIHELESAAREAALQYLSDMGQDAERYDALYRAAQVMAEALEYIMDGYGLNAPDFRQQETDEHGELIQDDWIVARCRAALSAHKGAGNE